MRKKIKNAESADSRRKNLFLFISILAVIAVSGCIVPGGDVFAGMFSPQRPATTEASADLITVQNTNIIPNPPISASTDASNTNGFTVSFEVKNNDEKNEVQNVGVTNYDWGLCKQGKTPTGAGGGVVRSDIVQDTGGANVTTFTVTGPDCGTGQPLVLADNTGLVSRTVCGQTANYEIKHLDGYTFYLYIGGNSYLYYKYKDYATSGGGTTYNCAKGETNSQCTQKFSGNGFSYTIKEIRNTATANCIGDSICTDDCPSYCDQQNTACKNNCNGKYTGENQKDLLKGCLNQCDNYALVSSAYQNAPCRPDYNPSFNGQCCKCVYATTGFPQSTTSAPVAGAKPYQPLQTELFEYGFTAPTNKDIGNMPSTCALRYKITYTFTAKTQTNIVVISQDKIEELQRSGQPPSVSPSQSVGVGPIKVFFDFGASQPVKSGDVIPVFITVEDKGSGLLDTGKVPSGKLKITVPPEFKTVAGGCDKFVGSGTIQLQNAADIPMIKKKSPQLRCSFKAPSVTDMKTFYITAELQYDYKFDNQISVAVNPTLVR